MSTTAASQPDGRPRTSRGVERREAILAATVRVLGASGLGAVTHRAVAREAGVPLAATTYYFSSKDELLDEALERLAGEEMQRLERQATALDPGVFREPSRLAAAMTDVLVPKTAPEREALLAKYEVYLEATRRRALRKTARHWIGAFREIASGALAAAGAPDPERQAPLLVAAIDGILMHQLATGGSKIDRDEVRAELERLIVALVG